MSPREEPARFRHEVDTLGHTPARSFTLASQFEAGSWVPTQGGGVRR